MDNLEAKFLGTVISLPAVSIVILFGYCLVGECSKEGKPSSGVELVAQKDLPVQEKEFDENGCRIDPTFIPWKNEDEVNTARKMFIQENYGKIAKQQNQRFGLGDFKVPLYHFKYMHQGEGQRDGGFYDYKTRQITFSLSAGKKGGWTHSLDEEYNCAAISRGEIEDATDYNIRHELGHGYFYSEAKKLGQHGWFVEDEHAGESQESLASKMIIEGFAEYMNHRRNPTSDMFIECSDPTLEKPSSYDWKKPFVHETNNKMYHHKYIYGCGYTLVAPILERDFHEGLEYILKHPPTIKDLSDLPKYQKKVLKSIQ